MRLFLTILPLAFFFFHSCADYRAHYDKSIQGWEQSVPSPGLSPVHTVYLVGDAGYTPDDTTAPALVLLGEKLRDAGKNSTVAFLGDNIYPNGMAPSDGEDREQDEARLRAQLDILKGYDGHVFFIAGNHDWYGYGIEGLKREKKFIEKYLDRDDVFLPKPGCGDPVEVELSDNLTLILIDSQWFLENWDDEYEVNDGCEIKSREMFREYVEEAIKGNRNKNVLIAIHHPPHTYGPHGGQFTLKQHIFPLTDLNKNLWIPLPVL
ncbi:MAG: metallophosphoesterase, partial [Phaeodactylibacter sp.]|nr:metallophosphoesterase [Phaeodactylibacter sp.]